MFPQSTGSHDAAVVAAARLVVNVAPPVLSTNLFTVVGLVRDSEVDQKPRQVRSNPGAPAVGMFRVPEGRHPRIFALEWPTRTPSAAVMIFGAFG